MAECVNIGAMEFDKLTAFAKEENIDLTVIGMDEPLVGGIVDALLLAESSIQPVPLHGAAGFLVYHFPKLLLISEK